MLEEKRFHVLPKMSIRPDKIVFYNQFVKVVETPKYKAPIDDLKTKMFLASIGCTTIRAVENNKHNFELSHKAASNIKTKVSWLYSLAKNKTVSFDNGQKSFSFKMNFITLTLPAVQKCKTSEITKICLNQFLTECKDLYNLQNYVWRLEFQKNGNAHYHIATDSFIPHKKAIEIWNRCINKLGFVDNYQKQMIGLSYQDYFKKYSNNGQTCEKTLKRRYKKGVAFRWTNPNTVDVRAVNNAKNISFYIAKYITKKSEHSINAVVSEREETNTNLRLWFCSRSLSKLDKIAHYIEENDTLIDDFYKQLSVVSIRIFDYCKVLYFNILKQSNEFKRLAWLLFNRYAKISGYTPALC